MGEGGVEAEQDGEGPTGTVGDRKGLTVECGLLDLRGGGRNPPVPHPGLARGVELGRIEPILSAEEIIHERAKFGDRSKFLAALDRSPDVPDPFEADGEETTMTSTTQYFSRGEAKLWPKMMIFCAVITPAGS